MTSLVSVWRWWLRAGEAPARCLLLASAATLFLVAAGTVQTAYTIRPAYGLAGLAIAAGFPHVVTGWRRAPAAAQGAALAVVGSYVLAWILGAQEVIFDSARAGAHRDLVYLADLFLGLGAVGLAIELARTKRHFRGFVLAVGAGAVLAVIYASYQWFAQRYGWPLSDVNNTLDSNGLTSEGNQGAGLLGWERARGTFLEPHFLGGYIASTLPVLLALAVARDVRAPARWMARLGIVLAGVALVAAASAPAFALMVIALPAALAVLAIAHGRPVTAAVATTAACGVLLLGLLAGPDQLVETATGRSGTDVALTTDFRTATWDRAIELWSQRPLTGSGPGQASVRLSLDRLNTPVDKARPGALRSAHGWWSAALLDAGLLGLLAVATLVAASLIAAFQAAARSDSLLVAGVAVAALLAVASSSFAGDRLDLRVWLLLGLGLSAASCMPRAKGRKADEAATDSAG